MFAIAHSFKFFASSRFTGEQSFTKVWLVIPQSGCDCSSCFTGETKVWTIVNTPTFASPVVVALLPSNASHLQCSLSLIPSITLWLQYSPLAHTFTVSVAMHLYERKFASSRYSLLPSTAAKLRDDRREYFVAVVIAFLPLLHQSFVHWWTKWTKVRSYSNASHLQWLRTFTVSVLRTLKCFAFAVFPSVIPLLRL